MAIFYAANKVMSSDRLGHIMICIIVSSRSLLIHIAVSLQVYKLDINFISSQINGVLYIYDGNNVNAVPIATLSGQLSLPFTSYMSSNNRILIRYVSGNVSAVNSFRISYMAVAKGI